MDPVTVKSLWDRLVAIVDEATVAQYRTAFSTVVQEANDFACSLLDPRGETLASSRLALPSFVTTQAITLRALLAQRASSTMRPGDVFVANDPWMCTGQAMDLTLLSPIFKDEQLVAFAGSVAHSPDLGGVQRWNRSTDVFEEALRIPFTHLVREGRRNRELMELIRHNSRLPDATLGDVEAQLTAIQTLKDAVLDLLHEYGLSDLDELSVEIYSRCEKLIRSVIEQIPDGVYRGEVISDGFPDPLLAKSQPVPNHICATVTVTDSQISVDFAGSSPQRASSFNSVWTFSSAYAAYAIRLILVPSIPHNGGFLRPVRVMCPEGTVVSARFPAPCLSRHIIGHQVCDAVYAALAPAIPERVFAQAGATPVWDLLLMGEDAHGRPFHRLILINGGMGGSSWGDGHTVSFPANVANTPVEILESLMPLLIECKAVIPDSAGAGRRRGGFGQRMIFRALNSMGYALINARVRHAPEGLLGGRPGRAGRATVHGEEIPPGSDGELYPGGALLLDTPGGGGWGSPGDREVERVLADVRVGLVSIDEARSNYGVVVDSQSVR